MVVVEIAVRVVAAVIGPGLVAWRVDDDQVLPTIWRYRRHATP